MYETTDNIILTSVNLPVTEYLQATVNNFPVNVNSLL